MCQTPKDLTRGEVQKSCVSFGKLWLIGGDGRDLARSAIAPGQGEQG